jgi:hypothetical protein
MSCSCQSVKRKVVYTYDDIAVTRFDTNNETFFYYGKLADNEVSQKPNMKINWGQRDGGFDGFLIFIKIKALK